MQSISWSSTCAWCWNNLSQATDLNIVLICGLSTTVCKGETAHVGGPNRKLGGVAGLAEQIAPVAVEAHLLVHQPHLPGLEFGS